MTIYHVSAQAETPPMGWNSWDLYGCDVNEDKIKAMADSMVDK
jgi:alpha-galactosidase